jgi:hypothetical protein
MKFSWRQWLQRPVSKRAGKRRTEDQLTRLYLESLEGRVLPSFTFSGKFHAGTRPDAVAVTDVNGDGNPDLIVANLYSANVSVLLGNGNGTFQAPSNFFAGYGPVSLAAADINGDGIPDLIVANQFSQYASVLLGNGDGTFENPITSPVGPYISSSVAVADVNGDGIPDLVVADQQPYPFTTTVPGKVTVLRGHGDGTFAAPLQYSVGIFPTSVAAADVNGDGHPDLVVANEFGSNGGAPGSYVSVLLSNGNGTFGGATEFPAGYTPVSLAVADLRGDGKPDLIVANLVANYVSVLLGTGTGTFGTPTNFAVGSYPGSVAAADVNGDGHPDLVVANTKSNSVSVLLGQGDGSFQTAQTLDKGLTRPSAVVLADVNGDGSPDLAVVDHVAVNVFLNDSAPSFSLAAPQSLHAGSYVYAVATADLNGDGKPDLVLANKTYPGTVSVLLGQGDGTFQAPVNYDVGYNPSSIAVADVDGDGHPDLIVANQYSDSVSVLLNNGDGTFHPAVGSPYPVGSFPVSVVAADLTGDGHPDIVVANEFTFNGYGNPYGSVSVLLGNGNGTFKDQSFSTASPPRSVALADINGDGKPDLIVAYQFNSSISVLLGNGNGTFGAPTPFTVGYSPYVVVAADLTGDGHNDDLVVANHGSGTVSVLLGNGNGTFLSSQTFAAGSYARTVTVADINGDGKPDLIVANDTYAGTVSTVSVLFGNGDGSFQPAQPFAATYPTSLAVADFNGDGRPDVAFGSSTGASLLLNVSPVATHLQIGAPTTLTAGNSTQVTVTALSADTGFGDVSAGFTGTIALSSSDRQFVAPAPHTYTLTDEGAFTFNISGLNTAGSRTITATDTVNGSVTGTAVVEVTPANATMLEFKQQPTTTTAGQPFNPSLIVAVEDPYRNVVTGDTSAVTLSLGNNPGGAMLSGTTTVNADNGIATFSNLSLNKSSTGYTLTADDGSLTGATSNPFTINAAAATSLTLAAPSSINVGIAFSLTVTAFDQFGNIATGYLGTVHFASSDQGPTLPPDYTFSTSDQGVHTFQSVILRTAGNQTVTVADTVHGFSPPPTTIMVISPNGNTDTRTWNGHGNTNNWSNPANWDEGIAPDANDSLIFGDIGAVVFTANNDFADGTVFNSITFTGSGGYLLTGNAIGLAAGVVGGTNAGVDTINLAGIVFTAEQSFNAFNGSLVFNTPINLNGFNFLIDGTLAGSGPDALNGVISGAGQIVKVGESLWNITGSNTFVGGLEIQKGVLFINNSASLGTTDGSTTIDAGASLQVGGNITLAEPLVISGNGSNASPGAIHVNDQNGLDTFTGTITLGMASALFGVPGLATVNLAGTIQNQGFDLTIAGVFNTSLTGTVIGTGQVFAFGSIFSGTGKVTGTLNVGQGTLSPGTPASAGSGGAPGVLTSGNVALPGTDFQVVINGQDVGTGYSQLNADGSVDLTGSSLQTVLPTGFSPRPDKAFTIITSTGPIIGTFNGLPNGSTVVLNGQTFFILYMNATGAMDPSAPASRVVICPDPMIEVGGLSVFPAAPTAGQSLTLTATISLVCPPAAGHSGDGGLVVPLPKAAAGDGGMVTFSEDGVPIGSGAFTNGTASFSTGPLTAGLHDFSAISASGSPMDVQVTVIPITFTPVINPPILPGQTVFATGAGPGGGPEVNVYDAKTGSLLFNFFAFDPNFTGGVRVAVGNVNGSGIPDIIVAAGTGGGPNVRVWDGATGRLVADFMAYNGGFTGGVWVAAGDVNGDGKDDIITGADAGGGPEVQVFDGASVAAGMPRTLSSFFAFDPNFLGGVRVAAGDVNGDRHADIIVGAGAGGGPEVRVFNGADPSQALASFFAYDPNFTGGVFVAVGAIDGDANADIITGAGAGDKPKVKVFDGDDVTNMIQSYIAFNNPGFTGGVSVGAATGVNGATEILNGAGAGGGPEVTVTGGASAISPFFSYPVTFSGGVFVGGK